MRRETIGFMAILSLISVIFALLIFTLFIAARSYTKERIAWEEFSIAHNCKKVSYEKGTSSVGMGTGLSSKGNLVPGMVVISSESKTGYLCDDGVTYYR